MNERTVFAKFREELGERIRNMREKRIDRNMEEEGEELEKCMKRIVGRTIEKVYGVQQDFSHIINCISD